MHMFCRSLFVLLYFSFWPLCCLSFFDLWILITPLVSLNHSLTGWVEKKNGTDEEKHYRRKWSCGGREEEKCRIVEYDLSRGYSLKTVERYVIYVQCFCMTFKTHISGWSIYNILMCGLFGGRYHCYTFKGSVFTIFWCVVYAGVSLSMLFGTATYKQLNICHHLNMSLPPARDVVNSIQYLWSMYNE